MKKMLLVTIISVLSVSAIATLSNGNTFVTFCAEIENIFIPIPGTYYYTIDDEILAPNPPELLLDNTKEIYSANLNGDPALAGSLCGVFRE